MSSQRILSSLIVLLVIAAAAALLVERNAGPARPCPERRGPRHEIP